MNTQPRTFLLEITDNDAHQACRYGPMITLFARGERRPGYFDPQFSREIAERLRHWSFDPDRDYVVLTGKHTAVAVLVAAVATEYGSFTGLAFDSRDASRGYRPLTMGVKHASAR